MLWSLIREGKKDSNSDSSKKTITMSIDRETYLKFKLRCHDTGRKVSPYVQILMQKYQEGSYERSGTAQRNKEVA